MYKKELFEIFEEMIEVLGRRSLLDEIFDALPSDVLEEILEPIANGYDLGYLFEDE